MIIYQAKYKKKNKLNDYTYTYTETSLELGEPCEVILLKNSYKITYEELPKVNLYPIKVEDYEEFNKYASYLLLGKEHLQITDNVSLLTGLIYKHSISKSDSVSPEDIIKKIPYVLEDLCDLLEMVTHIEFDVRAMNNGNSFMFIGKDGDGRVIIDDDNFDIVRNVVMKMNLLKEPKYFEDKLYEQMYYNAIKANRKEGASFSDVIATVVQDMKYTYEYVSQLSIFQLYVLYSRIAHVKFSDAITIYRTCNDKLPDISYTDGVIDKLFKEQDDSDLFADLGGIADKLT